MRKTISQTENGYFLVLSVIFIVVIGLMGNLIVHIFSSRALLSVHQQKGMQTFYNAEAGLEIATRLLTTPNLNTMPTRLACGNLTGTSQLTNATLNNGVFTVTAINNSPLFATSSLSAAITANATSIAITNAAGFAPSGRVIIDNEAINYTTISGNTLLGVTRGVGSTLASSHANDAGVGQYQCLLDVEAGMPNLSSPIFQRELQWDVQLQDGWMVGARAGSNFTIANWNRSAELTWTNDSLAGGSVAANLNSISMLSNASGWAVGDVVAGGNFTFLRWNGSAWSISALSGACAGQHLESIVMVSSQQGFAVGIRYRPGCSGGGSSRRYTILQWDGNAWSLLAPTTTPSIPADSAQNQDLNAVHVIDNDGDGLANLGFAVGNDGTILQYNGNNWISNTSPTSQDLHGVFTVSATEAWAVGASGTILRWNGSNWSMVNSGVASNLTTISMYDTNNDGVAEFGVIAGASGSVLIYNGATWSAGAVGTTNFFASGIYNVQDAWIGGASGALYHWDGSAWSSINSATSQTINSIGLVRMATPVFSGWRQVFH